MPVYEYLCAKGHRYEKTEGFSAPSTQKCLTCSAKAKRQISMPAVIFKGSGFYSTDNRGSGAKSSASSVSSSDDGDAPSAAPAASADNGHGHSHGDDKKSTKIDASVD